jgi:acyl-CoA synthetase (AMP-forming)/AMP-acid ligase II
MADEGDSVDRVVPSTFNLADLWEAVVPHVADRIALVCGDRRLTYAELAERADRLAAWMAEHGVGPGDHIGVHLINGTEYIEALLAAWKLRAVPVNVNYRYLAGELVHLYTDAGLVGVVHQRSFAPRIAAIADQVPSVRWWLSVDDPPGAEGADAPEVGPALEELASVGYEEALATTDPGGPWPERFDDDRYLIYTGGTTGLPKGVVWRQDDAFFACIGGGDPMRLQGPVSSPAEVLDRIVGGPFVFFPVAPLMHAAGQWTSLSWLLAGGTVVLLPGSLDAHAVWQAIAREGVNVMAVVGDAVVRPLLDAWDEAGGYEVPSLISIGSGGAPLSPVLKQRLMDALPAVGVVDGFGSSETGAQGSQRLEPGAVPGGGVTAFTPYGETTTVLDEATLEPVVPGSGAVGRVALRGHIPLGYHNDPAKTAATFVEAGGHRWVLTGDMATVEADGKVTLLGRGSACINTGGEKVYPEEVEAVLKAHPAVYDVTVVGVPDERWGQAVCAVVQPVAGTEPTADELIAHVRAALAGYKVPKQVVLVDRVERSPAGKPDHRWARAAAEGAAAG